MTEQTTEPTIDIQKHATTVLAEALEFIYSEPGGVGVAEALIKRLDANGLVIAAKPADAEPFTLRPIDTAGDW